MSRIDTDSIQYPEQPGCARLVCIHRLRFNQTEHPRTGSGTAGGVADRESKNGLRT